MTAASLNFWNASARSASAFASASPLVNVMPRLGIAFQRHALAPRPGVDLDTLALRLALDLDDRRLGLAGQLLALGFGLGGGDLGRLVALGAPDDGLGLGLGRTDRGRQQLLLLARRLEVGQLGLPPGDLLLCLGLGQRTGLRGARLGGGGLRQHLRAAQLDVALGVDLDLVRLGLADGGLLVGSWPWPCAHRARRWPSSAAPSRSM